MCGRFAFFSPAEAINAAFGMSLPAGFKPRYNIAPTQNVTVIHAAADGQRAWASMRWGLVPAWAKDPAIGNRMINARVETVAEKPAYRSAFRSRRCLVPASGFYEWHKDADGQKTPWFISRADGQPLAMAAIWERRERKPADAEEVPELLQSCSIITTSANPFMQELHERMPVILGGDDYDVWMQPDADTKSLHQQVSQPVRVELQAWPVSRNVNNPRNDGAGLIEPADRPD